MSYQVGHPAPPLNNRVLTIKNNKSYGKEYHIKGSTD